MDITTTNRDDTTVVQIQGNLDTGTAPTAEEHLQGLIDDGKTKILMDFSTLDYISSAGLRVLLSTSKKLRSSGGEIRLHSLNETVAEIFDMSGFSTILSVFPGEAEALEGF